MLIFQTVPPSINHLYLNHWGGNTVGIEPDDIAAWESSVWKFKLVLLNKKYSPVFTSTAESVTFLLNPSEN